MGVRRAREKTKRTTNGRSCKRRNQLDTPRNPRCVFFLLVMRRMQSKTFVFFAKPTLARGASYDVTEMGQTADMRKRMKKFKKNKIKFDFF